MSEKIRILQVTSGFRKGVSGGIAAVLHNYCSSPVFDTDIAFDYLSLGYQTYEPYRTDLENTGGKLFCLNIHSSGMKLLLDIYMNLKKFLKNNRYDIVHVNSGALTQVLVCCIAAKHAGIKVVIAHSHNSIFKTGFKGKIYGLLKSLFRKYADVYFACSKMAAESMFPADIIDNDKWIMIPNAIDIKKYVYNAEIREKYRKEMNLDGKFVVGHVGRFNQQKNHEFLIDVFTKVAEANPDAVLLLVGAGDLQEQIKAKAENSGLKDRVIFTGQRTDANNLMQAMDVFAFPSLFEGLGMSLIESQVSGLPVVASDQVPIEDTRLTTDIKYVSLNDIEKWVVYISNVDADIPRIYRSRIAVQTGRKYELDFAAEKLKKLYLELVRDG